MIYDFQRRAYSIFVLPWGSLRESLKIKQLLYNFKACVTKLKVLSPKEFENDTNLTLTPENWLYDASRGLTKYFAA